MDGRRDLAGAEHGVDLRDLLLQLVAITLGEAAGDDQPAARPVLLVLRHLENRVDRLLLRAIDERARVHHQDVSLGRVGRELVAGLLRKAEHDFGDDEVRWTAERDQSNLHYGYSL